MQRHTHTGRNPFWRKIIIVAFLPIITLIWMIGWILTQIGDQGEYKEISQKTLQTYPGCKTYVQESEASNEDIEDSDIAYEPEIIA